MCAYFTRKVQNILNFHILAGFRLWLKIKFMNIIVKAINQVMLVNWSWTAKNFGALWEFLGIFAQIAQNALGCPKCPKKPNLPQKNKCPNSKILSEIFLGHPVYIVIIFCSRVDVSYSSSAICFAVVPLSLYLHCVCVSLSSSHCLDFVFVFVLSLYYLLQQSRAVIFLLQHLLPLNIGLRRQIERAA